MDTEKKTNTTTEQDAAPEAPAIIQDAATVTPAQAPEAPATPEATEDRKSVV